MSTELSTYQSKYVAKKAFFSFMGNTFRIFDSAGQLQFFVKQKAFKLKEEINVYADEGQKDLRLTIKARGWGDFSGVYDIIDASTGDVVGAGKRHGLKSIFRDEWSILDAEGNDIGKVMEGGGCLLVLRKIIKFIPTAYDITIGETKVGHYKQQLNPLQLAFDVEFTDSSFDPRLGVGMAVLILAIEGSIDSAK